MDNKTKGILYIIASAFFFSLMSLFVRMAGDLPTMEKAFFRNAIAAIVAIIISMAILKWQHALKK